MIDEIAWRNKRIYDLVSEVARLTAQLADMTTDLGKCRCESALRADEIQRLAGELAGRPTIEEIERWGNQLTSGHGTRLR